MTPQQLEKLLNQVANDEIGPQDALQALKTLPFEDLGFACVDHHRLLRQGSPEVIYAEFKTVDEVVTIAQAVLRQGANLLCTRLQTDAMGALKQAVEGIVVYERP